MNTFYHGDCLFIMTKDILPETVDLIYLDPPFFTGKVQRGSEWRPEAMKFSYDDSRKFWEKKGLHQSAPEWLKYIANQRPDFAAYLYYMMVRLQACHRVLKGTGSIYLHCDWRASHYLKMIMDEPTVFGHNNFRNEIIWFYPDSPGRSQKDFPSKHDIIFRYARGKFWTFNDKEIRIPILDASKERYKSPRILGGKRYLGGESSLIGKIPEDVWRMPVVKQNSGESVGYPTQKPLALLERIIRASSNEGDLILDPFCGCGTAIIAAHKLNRHWIGIDINKVAYDVTQARGLQMPLGMREEFAETHLISRNLEEVKALSPTKFEKWVNEFYKATKPYPEAGIDGITPDGIGIQTKTFNIGYAIISQLVTDAKCHPKTTQPIRKVIAVSQQGFDDKARQRQFAVKTSEGIEVLLMTPEDMLSLDQQTREEPQ